MTPSAYIFAAAAPELIAEDSRGRRLTLKRMNALDRLRLFKAAGPGLVENQLWLGMAALACSVTAIDDVPVPMPANEHQIEALVSRLGDEGIAAIAEALSAFQQAQASGAASPGN